MMKSNLTRLAFFVALIILWTKVANAHIWDPTLFPPPSEVWKTLWGSMQDGTLKAATLTSLRRVLEGYGISLLIGTPLGIMIARSQIMEDTVGSLVSGLQALPSICWLPLALLWFQLSDKAIVFVVVMGSFVSITVAVQDGLRNLPPTYVRAAKTLGASGFGMVTQVLLPASLPAVLTAAKMGWAYAWRALMSGELLFVSIGLGHLLMEGRDLADMSQVMAVMIVIITIGLLTDRVVFGVAEGLVRRRFGLART